MSASTLRLIFLILAIIFAAVFTAIGFGWLWDDFDHPFGWLGLALVFGYASRLP